ncbi:Testis-expressed sequence 11 protein [Cytospora mali]|uniref:Testis-expressed sequence 11 protein n=1 Tax=Cytospora mali TaxID=578113 RepID=A0A194VCC2_CYTMA|nr:Testis-expressed sequence 11 protein [Valsa mali var. pyri (nom. inval.)]
MARVSDAVNGGHAASESSGRSRRKEAILSFTSDLQRRLPVDKDDPTAASALLSLVQKQAQTIERYAEKAHHDFLEDVDLEREGTNLWNLCTRLNREDLDRPGKPSITKVVLWSRVLAFQMLHLCQWSASKSTSPVACHLLKLAMKVAKFCIDDHDAQTARLVLQRAVDYHGRLHDLSQEEHDANECIEFDAEWTVLRIALAWQDDQVDVAEHLFVQKAEKLLKEARPRSAENIIDVLFQIGRGILLREDFKMAEKWLQRAWDSINSQKLQEMSRDAVELRMAIIQSLVGALMGLQTTDGIEKAHNLVKYMESEIGDQPVILLLSLEILNRSPAEVFDSEAYANILRRMIRTFRPKDSSFKLLTHHIRKLHTKSPTIGCSLLDEFLASLVKGGHSSWIDTVVVTRIYMAISHRDFEGNIDDAEKALLRVENPVGSDASFSVHTLIWKKIETNYSQGQYNMAERWCRLALSPVLVNSGPLNIGKLQRKMILCAIGRNDLDSARSIYYSMSEGAQGDHNTQYLMYKVAVRSGDRAMAAECLGAIAQESPKQLVFLYACVADGQRAGDKLVAVDALKKLADVYDFEHPGQVHLPALLRCTVMLLHTTLESGEEKNSIIISLCDIFDGVVTAAKKAPKDENGNKLFDARELEWFCQNSYNLGLKHVGDWDLCNVVRILNACVNIIRQFPDDIPEETAADLSLKSIFCNFLISSALISLARSQDNLEEQLQKYLVLRRHVAEADREVQRRLESKSLDEVSSTDLVGKLALLLAFDFEAAAALKRWHELSEIVLKASTCRNLEAFKTMADCILRAHAPAEELFSVLRKIINEIASLEDSDPIRLAKYTRCLFQTIAASNEELGGRLLDEACSMAGEAHGTPSAWPTEELEWFAAAAYNHSIDLWGRDEDEACRWWAQKAMSIAHYCQDGGHLDALLRDKYAKLRLNAEGE